MPNSDNSIMQIKLPDTLARVGARCDVSLPMRVQASALTIADWCYTILFNTILTLIVIRRSEVSRTVFVVGLLFFGAAAILQMSKFLARVYAGEGQISISRDAVEDTRLESGPIPWNCVEGASTGSSDRRQSSCWVELRLTQGLVRHPMRDSLRVRGWPAFRSDRAWIEVWTADDRGVVLGTILELARQAEAKLASPKVTA